MARRLILAGIALAWAAWAADCPITAPPNPPFVAPAPHTPIPSDTRSFWYGTDNFWTALRVGGLWQALPHNDQGYRQKIFLWSRDYNRRTEPQPDLRISGRRLDGDAPPFVVEKGTNAISVDGTAAMLTGINIPTTGCWEITSSYHGHELTFVVKVEDQSITRADLSGKWKVSYAGPEGMAPKTVGAMILDLQFHDERVAGTIEVGGWPGEAPLADGKIYGNRIIFTATGSRSSTTGIPTCQFVGEVRDGEMVLKMTVIKNAGGPLAPGVVYEYKGGRQ
jgi:hypothetical protein